MTFIVSFSDVNPPARNDGQPWTTVQISEASQLAGPWTVIDTITLSPTDTNPSQPAARSFTTHKATVEQGYYTATFLDAAGGSSHPIEQVQDVPSQIAPSLSDLGSFMRARTVVAGTGGSEIGTFNSQTRPTDQEALAIIQQAVNQVLMEVGEQIPDRMIIQARFLAVLYAAQLVELTFYRNEVTRDQSAYEQYAALYQRGVTALRSSISEGGPAAPQASFASVPVLNAQQQHWQQVFAAMSAQTGLIDPSKLGPSEFYPMGVGGIPANLLAAFPLLFGDGIGFDTGLAFLED